MSTKSRQPEYHRPSQHPEPPIGTQKPWSWLATLEDDQLLA
jgi:hypothetical protein